MPLLEGGCTSSAAAVIQQTTCTPNVSHVCCLTLLMVRCLCLPPARVSLSIIVQFSELPPEQTRGSRGLRRQFQHVHQHIACIPARARSAQNKTFVALQIFTTRHLVHIRLEQLPVRRNTSEGRQMVMAAQRSLNAALLLVTLTLFVLLVLVDTQETFVTTDVDALSIQQAQVWQSVRELRSTACRQMKRAYQQSARMRIDDDLSNVRAIVACVAHVQADCGPSAHDSDPLLLPRIWNADALQEQNAVRDSKLQPSSMKGISLHADLPHSA